MEAKREKRASPNLNVHMEGSVFSDFDCISPFSNVPLEIIMHILSFLPYQSLQSARLVCKRWYAASMNHKQIDKDLLVIDKKDDTLNNEKLSLINKCKRDFFHLKIEMNRSVWSNGSEFWFNFGKRLRSLKMKNCSIIKSDFYKAIRCCPDLKHLSVSWCDFICPAQNIDTIDDMEDEYYADCDLDNLERLEIMGNRLSNYKLFHEIVAIAPNLSSLFLDRCLVQNEPYGSRRLSVKHVLRYLKKNLNREFDLSLYFVVNPWNPGPFALRFEQLMMLPNIRPKILSSNHFPKHLARSQLFTSLRVLELRGSLGTDMDDAMLECICRNSPNLETLVIKLLGQVSNAVKHLALLKKLSSLYLGCVCEVEDTAFLAGLCSEVNDTLKDFRLDVSRKTTSKFFIEFARTHPSLECLRLELCAGFDNWALQAVFKYQVLVKSLYINSYGEEITDAGVLGAVFDGPLHEDQQENPTGHAISNLKGLRSLDLLTCQVTMETLAVVFENHPKIDHLGLVAMPITDDFLCSLPTMLQHLKDVFLLSCNDITLNGVKFLRRHHIHVTHSVGSVPIAGVPMPNVP